jgi:hypothetical protein
MKPLSIFFMFFLAALFCGYLVALGSKSREGFQSHAFASCHGSGFSKEFCLQNPMPGQCLCRNGAMGTFMPGFKGRCVCSD